MIVPTERAQELQLLRQLARGPKGTRIITNHSATIEIGNRLDRSSEAIIFPWTFGKQTKASFAIEITAAGRRTMGIKSSVEQSE